MDFRITNLYKRADQIRVYAEIKKDTVDKLKKERIDKIADDTINTINLAIRKCEKMDINDENYDLFIDTVSQKVEDAYKSTISKIDEICKMGNIINDIEKEIINVANDVQNSINDFINNPETKKAINDVKTNTIKVAEKGLDTLKSILKVK